MDLDPKELAALMLKEAQAAAGESWEEIAEQVQVELGVLSVNLTTLYQLKVYGDIDDNQAEKHFKMIRNAAEAWQEALKGQALIGAQNAINAALAAVRKFIQDTFGWVIFF